MHDANVYIKSKAKHPPNPLIRSSVTQIACARRLSFPLIRLIEILLRVERSLPSPLVPLQCARDTLDPFPTAIS